MPRNPVTDPITDQEIAFARLILSGTMTDRDAAEAVGLNPSTAAYTKSKPRVRAYMVEHRTAINQKLADSEAQHQRETNRTLDQIREQILDRLWQLANLNPEQTRGSIAGQVKAMSMIVAIQSLIPDRRLTPAPAQPAAPPVTAQAYKSAWLRQSEEQHQPEAHRPLEAQPATPPSSDALSARRDPTINPFVSPHQGTWVPDAAGVTRDANLNPLNPARLSIPSKGAFERRP